MTLAFWKALCPPTFLGEPESSEGCFSKTRSQAGQDGTEGRTPAAVVQNQCEEGTFPWLLRFL